MAVAVKTSPSLILESPRPLFEGHYFSTYGVVGPTWDISPDGKRFLMVKQMSEESENPKISVIVNWFEELKQKVPSD